MNPSYAGLKTFAKSPYRQITSLTDDVDVAVVGVPFDGAVTNRPGARFGPGALREASAWFARSLSSNAQVVNLSTGRHGSFEHVEIRDCGDISVGPNDVERTRENVEHAIEHIRQTSMPVILGGDHYLTYPAFTGVSKATDGTVGLVHLDAHTDLRDSSELFGRHFHGSQMARLHESPHLDPENHALIGVRGYDSPEFLETVERTGMTVYDDRAVRDDGIAHCVREALDTIAERVDAMYVTLDIDLVDPAFAPGTGTPEPGGITSSDLLRTMDILGERSDVAALDLVEIAPRIDPTDSTALLGAKAVVQFLEAQFAE